MTKKCRTSDETGFHLGRQQPSGVGGSDLAQPPFSVIVLLHRHLLHLSQLRRQLLSASEFGTGISTKYRRFGQSIAVIWFILTGAK